MKIASDEGQNLVPSQKYLASLGLLEEERVVDDKYATFPNIVAVNSTMFLCFIR